MVKTSQESDVLNLNCYINVAKLILLGISCFLLSFFKTQVQNEPSHANNIDPHKDDYWCRKRIALIRET